MSCWVNIKILGGPSSFSELLVSFYNITIADRTEVWNLGQYLPIFFALRMLVVSSFVCLWVQVKFFRASVNTFTLVTGPEKPSRSVEWCFYTWVPVSFHLCTCTKKYMQTCKHVGDTLHVPAGVFTLHNAFGWLTLNINITLVCLQGKLQSALLRADINKTTFIISGVVRDTFLPDVTQQ